MNTKQNGEKPAKTGPEQHLPILQTPAGGIPKIINTHAQLERAISKLAAASGPLAVDTERAHGYRYYHSAWLLQLRRYETETFLIDPMAFGKPANFAELSQAVADAEWVLHAAAQDLPCLREINLIPNQIFDTEFAARLLNFERVGLGAMIAAEFGIKLLKNHSADDWSRRPLPQEWLNYAALDVELLIELRDRLSQKLKTSGRWEWARQEFKYILDCAAKPPSSPKEPWRRISSANKIRDRRQLALIRELWRRRNLIAKQMDKEPTFLLSDKAILNLTLETDFEKGYLPSAAIIENIPGFHTNLAQAYLHEWTQAVRSAAALNPQKLPSTYPDSTQLAPAAPLATDHGIVDAGLLWQAGRAALDLTASQLEIKRYLLISSKTLRKVISELLADDFDDFDEASLAWALAKNEVRPWQIEIIAQPLAQAFSSVI